PGCNHCFVPSEVGLFFADDESVFRVPDDGTAGPPLWMGQFLGESDGLYMAGGCEQTSGPCLLRIRVGGPAPPETIRLPLNVHPWLGLLWGQNTHPALVQYAGDAFFITGADYRLSTDRKSVSRPVLMRVRAGSRKAEIVRCIPPP